MSEALPTTVVLVLLCAVAAGPAVAESSLSALSVFAEAQGVSPHIFGLVTLAVALFAPYFAGGFVDQWGARAPSLLACVMLALLGLSMSWTGLAAALDEDTQRSSLALSFCVAGKAMLSLGERASTIVLMVAAVGSGAMPRRPSSAGGVSLRACCCALAGPGGGRSGHSTGRGGDGEGGGSSGVLALHREAQRWHGARVALAVGALCSAIHLGKAWGTAFAQPLACRDIAAALPPPPFTNHSCGRYIFESAFWRRIGASGDDLGPVCPAAGAGKPRPAAMCGMLKAPFFVHWLEALWPAIGALFVSAMATVVLGRQRVRNSVRRNLGEVGPDDSFDGAGDDDGDGGGGDARSRAGYATSTATAVLIRSQRAQRTLLALCLLHTVVSLAHAAARFGDGDSTGQGAQAFGISALLIAAVCGALDEVGHRLHVAMALLVPPLISATPPLLVCSECVERGSSGLATADVAVLASYVVVQNVLRVCVPLCTDSTSLGRALGMFEVAGAAGRFIFVLVQRWVVSYPTLWMMVLNGGAVLLTGGILVLDHGEDNRLSVSSGRENADADQGSELYASASREERSALFERRARTTGPRVPTSSKFFAPVEIGGSMSGNVNDEEAGEAVLL